MGISMGLALGGVERGFPVLLVILGVCFGVCFGGHRCDEEVIDPSFIIKTSEGSTFELCVHEVSLGHIPEESWIPIQFTIQAGFTDDVIRLGRTFKFNTTTSFYCTLFLSNDDDIFEGTEKFTITLMPFQDKIWCHNTSYITITDNDVVLVGFNQSIIPTREGDGNFTIRVEVVSGTIAAGLNISFEYILQNGITDDINATSPSNIIEFTSSKIFNYISFEVNDDDIIESTESYTVTLLQESMQVEFVNATATIVITDNDNATLQVDQMLERSQIEGNLNLLIICVTLIELTSGGLDRDIIVYVTILDQTGTRGSDYVLDDTTLTFPSTSPVMQELCISVNITEDVLTETNETFTVIFTPGTQDIFQGGSNVTITIIDNDMVLVGFNQSIIPTREGDRNFTIRVEVVTGTIAVGLTIAIEYILQNESADDINATSPSNIIEFTSSKIFNYITFEVNDDDIIESTESYTITLLRESMQVEFVNATATIVITDNENATLQVDQMLERSQIEGNLNLLIICVTLIELTSGGLDRDIIVYVTILDQTGTRGSDYVLDDTTLTFPRTSPVMQELCISVNITEDVLTETNETFTVIFTPGTQDIFQGGSNVTITIIDNDMVLVGFNQSIIPTKEGDGNFTIRVEVVTGTIAVGLTIAIEYILQNESTDDINATSPSNIIEFTSSKIFNYISFEVNDDDIIESTESYTITLLQESMHVEFVNATSTIVITDNENATLQVDQMLERSQIEGNLNLLIICVTLIEVTSGGLDRDIIVYVTTLDQTATKFVDGFYLLMLAASQHIDPAESTVYPSAGGIDYMLDGTSLTFPSTSPVMQELCISVNITEDVLTETNETFTVIFTPGTQDIFQGGSNVTITIIDDDILRVAFNSSIFMTREGNDSFQFCIDVVNGAIDEGLTVSIGYTLQNGANSDINTNTSSIMFELISSANSDCILFGVIDDDIIESTENCTITLVQGDIKVEFVNDTATIVIIDNNSATVGINQPLNRSLVEGASGSLTTVTICVTLINILPGGLARDVIVDVTASDGTATGGSDYMFDGTSLTFFSMNHELCISVNITGDALTEENENFLVVFTLATMDIFQGGSTVTIIIIDDDTITTEDSLTRIEIGGILIAAMALFLLLFINVAALIYCCYKHSKRTSGPNYKPDGYRSRENPPNISQESRGDFAKENPYIITNYEDNWSMQSIQLVLQKDILNDSTEPQELRSGTGKEIENVMPETEHDATFETKISIGEDAADTAF